MQDIISLNNSVNNSSFEKSEISDKSQKYIKNLQLNLQKCETKIVALQNQIETFQNL